MPREQGRALGFFVFLERLSAVAVMVLCGASPASRFGAVVSDSYGEDCNGVGMPSACQREAAGFRVEFNDGTDMLQSFDPVADGNDAGSDVAAETAVLRPSAQCLLESGRGIGGGTSAGGVRAAQGDAVARGNRIVGRLPVL